MKRTSTLQVGPILQEKNDHKVKRETLFEEASRQLAIAAQMTGVSAREAAQAARGMRHISAFRTENMDEEVAHMAQQMSDDMDRRVMDSLFIEGIPGVNTIEPVGSREALPTDVPNGSLCYVMDIAESYVFMGGNWIQLQVERNEDGSIQRAHATVLNERIDRQS